MCARVLNISNWILRTVRWKLGIYMIFFLLPHGTKKVLQQKSNQPRWYSGTMSVDLVKPRCSAEVTPNILQTHFLFGVDCGAVCHG